jgi:hypothetical protein
MAATVLAKLAVEIAANVAGFNKALDNASTQTKKFGADIKKVAAGALAAFAITDIGKAIVQTTAEFQKFEAVLTNGLGSRSAAIVALNNITKFAATTPFEVEELTRVFIKWTNTGLNPSIEKLSKLGDVASSLGAGFEQTAEAFKDLAVGQTRRIEEIGITAQQANGKIQLSFKGVNLEIEKSAKGVDQALNVFSKLPGVFGASEAVSKTLTGQISNFKDNLNILAKSIGDRSSGLISGFLSFANDALGGLNEALNKNSELLRNQQVEINILVRSITDANTSEAARANLIGELNRKYPEFLANLDKEKVTNEELVNRLEDVNKQFLKKIALAAAEERLLETQRKINDAIDDEIEAQKELQRLQQKIVQYTPYGQPGTITSSLQNTLEITAAEKEIQVAKQKQKELQSDLNERLGVYIKKSEEALGLEFFQAKAVTETTGAVETKNKTATDGISEEMKALKELMKLRSMSFEELKNYYKDLRQVQIAPVNVKPVVETLGGEKGKLPIPPGFSEQLANYQEILNKGTESNFLFADSIEHINKSFGKAAKDGLASFFSGLSDVADKKISFGDNLLKAISEFMQQFGQQLIAIGVGKLSIGLPGGAAAIAAGGALLAISGAIGKGVSKRSSQRSASGTGSNFSSQTVSAAGMAGNITITGELKGSGRDLVAVINQTSFDNKIRKGG